MSDTILLNPNDWDILLDANANIAVASEPYALAQDVASACKLALGELWYNTDQGIPYFQSIFGKRPAISLLKQYFENAALSVPGVVKVAVNITAFENRNLSGTLRFTDQNGVDNEITL